MSHGVRRFTQLRAWQTCVAYKRAVYAICESSSLATNLKKRAQVEESVAGPPAHIAEGFGRFNPADFARFVVIARSSLMESQSHLLDLVDKNYIDEATREALDALAQAALQEVTGLMEYLQSPEALRNARRARERRIASRQQRRANQEQRTEHPEPRTENPEPRTEPEPEHEPRREKREE
jgi:four helix bundle protein